MFDFNKPGNTIWQRERRIFDALGVQPRAADLLHPDRYAGRLGWLRPARAAVHGDGVALQRLGDELVRALGCELPPRNPEGRGYQPHNQAMRYAFRRT